MILGDFTRQEAAKASNKLIEAHGLEIANRHDMSDRSWHDGKRTFRVVFYIGDGMIVVHRQEGPEDISRQLEAEWLGAIESGTG